jgi:hypothetical protein
MSSTADYNQLFPHFSAISSPEIIEPKLPVDVFVQEAVNLYHWCIDDREALTNVGLDWNLVLSLPQRAGACSKAQSLWVKERNSRKQVETDWKNQSQAAFALRDQLIHSFRFAFRKFEHLLAQLDHIAQGNSHSDMVQDLNDLAVLGKSNTKLLAAINFDPALLDRAADLSSQTGHLLGAANSERKKEIETKLIRNKAFTYLKQAVDEIRECGKYAFQNNPDRLRGYHSDYWKATNNNKRKKESDPPSN